MSIWMLAAALFIGVGGDAALAETERRDVGIERIALNSEVSGKPGEAASFDAMPGEERRGNGSRDDWAALPGEGEEDLTGSIARTDGDDAEEARREPEKPMAFRDPELGDEDNRTAKMNAVNKPSDMAAFGDEGETTGSIAGQSEDRGKPAARADDDAPDENERAGKQLEDGDEPRAQADAEHAEASGKPGAGEEND